ncbi:hypothetical protein CPB86DRAFT_872818 [Serendipita vermifera]|nr:hypothetical protein CPB86DRAFT_872818 [Serendipita vermifera]
MNLADRVDPIGTSLGVAGLLGQSVSLCLKGFDLWAQSDDLGPEATLFQTKLELQSGLLRAWEEHWGVSKGHHLLDRRFEGRNGNIAVNTITAIHELIASLDPIVEQYQLESMPNNAESSLARLHLLEEPIMQERLNYRNQQIDISQKVNRKEKLKWALQKGNVDKTLDNIKFLIDGLFKLLPPPGYDPSTAVLLNPTLTSPTPAKLDVLSSIDHSSLSSMIAGFRRLSEKLEGRLASSQVSDRNLKLPYRSICFESETDDPLRSTAKIRYRDIPTQDVFIEWKPIDPNLRGNKALTMARRVDNVARLLREDNKPVELRTTNCLGYCEKDTEHDESFVGYIYALPSPGTQPWSLAQVMPSLQKPDPSARKQLVYSISRALSLFHLSNWLHKGIRSHNILFFGDDNKSNVDLSEPYLAGFDFSRSDELDPMTEIPDASWDYDLYRHPQCQGLPVEPIREKQDAAGSGDGKNEAASSRNANSKDSSLTREPFCKQFDIYSIGVVMLEVGIWQSVSKVKELALKAPEYTQDKPVAFRDWMIQREVPKLESEMGRGFMEATLKCLRGDFSGKRPVEVEFYLDVILKVNTP